MKGELPTEVYAELLFKILGRPKRYRHAVNGYKHENPNASADEVREFSAQYYNQLCSTYPITDRIIHVLEEQVESLPEGPREVTRYMQGLVDGRPRGRHEVCQYIYNMETGEYGIPLGAVRDFEYVALRMLRHPSRSRRIIGTLGDMPADLRPEKI